MPSESRWSPRTTGGVDVLTVDPAALLGAAEAAEATCRSTTAAIGDSAPVVDRVPGAETARACDEIEADVGRAIARSTSDIGRWTRAARESVAAYAQADDAAERGIRGGRS